MRYIRCDRCGKDIGPESNVEVYRVSICFNNKATEYADCCAVCAALAKDWIDNFRAELAKQGA
jgi:hypothetical protein